MLKNTFCHIIGISKETEKNLWANGILCWEDLLKTQNFKKYTKDILTSQEALFKENFNYFNLPSSEFWRLYPHMKNKCCFLDIETTGLDKFNDEITTIGCFDGKNSRVFVNGIDIHEFSDYIKNYKLLVTFNGACFDIPFIKNNLNINLNHHHIDLRFALKKIGFSGGLKKIEKQLNLSRGDLEGLDGLEAIRLWYRYKKGDINALETLKRYNLLDVQNLLPLMEFTYEKLKENEFLIHI